VKKTLPLYLDLNFQQEGYFSQPPPPHFTEFIYVYHGTASVAGKVIPTQSLGLLAKNSASSGVIIEAPQGARTLLIAGQGTIAPTA
jgi:redox-sensitive bicupin YhaK (pirin superfamily)